MTQHFVISDLHLGMGKSAEGNWYPLEDFRLDESFKKFLDLLQHEKADELIINGDWIDFLQLEPFAYVPNLFSEDGHRLAWTESESKEKLESCRKGHQAFFEDLKSFLSNNRQIKLTVIMGNHDPDLFWPGVQLEMRNLLGQPSEDQLKFYQTPVRRGTAHIEHGNQYCSPENRFYNPENIIHKCTVDGKDRLEMVWGSVFVLEFFNELERKYPFADNVKTQSRALWLGIRNRWVGGAMAAKFVKFLWGAGIPWSSISANVLSSQSHRPDKLIQDLQDPALAQELLEIYDADPAFKSEFDAEIGATPAQEWKGINAPRPQQPLTLDQLTPDEGGQAVTMGIFRDEPEFHGAAKLKEQDGVEYVIFGHTHAEIDGADRGAKVHKYFNTGSWVGSIDLSKRENRKRLKNIKETDLNDDQLFDIRLRSVCIDLTPGRTSVELRSLEL